MSKGIGQITDLLILGGVAVVGIIALKTMGGIKGLTNIFGGLGDVLGGIGGIGDGDGNGTDLITEKADIVEELGKRFQEMTPAERSATLGLTWEEQTMGGVESSMSQLLAGLKLINPLAGLGADVAEDLTEDIRTGAQTAIVTPLIQEGAWKSEEIKRLAVAEKSALNVLEEAEAPTASLHGLTLPSGFKVSGR